MTSNEARNITCKVNSKMKKKSSIFFKILSSDLLSISVLICMYAFGIQLNNTKLYLLLVLPSWTIRSGELKASVEGYTNVYLQYAEQ